MSAGLSPLGAQTLPGTVGEDLTRPPEMRGIAAAPNPASPDRSSLPSRKAPHAHPGRQADAKAGPDVTPRHVTASTDHSVELGVTMRGGSGAPRAYAPTGASEAIQESGSAFGAGMKFGF